MSEAELVLEQQEMGSRHRTKEAETRHKMQIVQLPAYDTSLYLEDGPSSKG